jgi:eukaryotic-like serine/threonine-protein kinase
MSPEMPDQIGRYVVKRRLGGGGMGVVYLAHDPVIDRPVAVKVLRTALDDDDMRERFAREVRATGGLVHRNIVTIHDAGEHQGLPFIAMQFVDGRSVAEIIQKAEPLTLDARLSLLEDLCSGLAYAHHRGLVHRDIKPANLMVGTDGVLRILDFGIARLMDASRASFTTVGTPGYMSPEQILAEKVDHRSDLFGVGLVLYELLSYKRAFPGSTLPRIMHAVLHEEPKPLREAAPGLDEGLIAIVERAMKKNPADRYPDASAMAMDVRAVRVRLLDSGAATVQLPSATQSTVMMDGPPPVPTIAYTPLPVSSPSLTPPPTPYPAPTPTPYAAPTPYPQATPPPYATPAPYAQPTPPPYAQPTPPPYATPTPPPTRRRTLALAVSAAGALLLIGAASGYLGRHLQHAPQAATTAVPEPNDRDPDMRWVNIAAGEFYMGCVPGDTCAKDEQHRHKVRLSHAFMMQATEVTWGQFRKFAQTHGIDEPPVPDYPVKNDLPVVNVTFDEALTFCRASGGRLPTEAEWEYAARAGQVGWKRGWGNGDPLIDGKPAANLADESYRRASSMKDSDLKAAAGDPPIWIGYDDGFGYPAPVGSFAPNAFGLYDMSGNVREWIADWEHASWDDYSRSHDPVGPPTGTRRGVRGDAFWSRPKWSRLSAREFVEPDHRETDLGFRCAR